MFINRRARALDYASTGTSWTVYHLPQVFLLQVGMQQHRAPRKTNRGAESVCFTTFFLFDNERNLQGHVCRDCGLLQCNAKRILLATMTIGFARIACELQRRVVVREVTRQ